MDYNMVDYLKYKTNNLLLGYSYHHQQAKSFGLPLIDQIELTNVCNLKCPMCPQPYDMKRPKNYMSVELFGEIMNQLKFYQLPNTGLHHFGEVLLHKNLEEIFKLIPNYSMSKMGFSTNAALLTKEKSELILKSNIDWLLMDFDTFDATLFEQYRPGTTMQIVHDNIVNFLELKKKYNSNIDASVQMISMKGNESEVEKFKKYWLGKGASKVNVQKFIVHDDSLEEKYDDFTPEDINNKLTRKGTCQYPWLNVVITWDGKIVPCCRDYDASIVLGDMKKNSLEDIWKSSEYKEFREAHINKKFENYEACKNCGSFISEPLEKRYPYDRIIKKLGIKL